MGGYRSNTGEAKERKKRLPDWDALRRPSPAPRAAATTRQAAMWSPLTPSMWRIDPSRRSRIGPRVQAAAATAPDPWRTTADRPAAGRSALREEKLGGRY